MSSSSLIRWGGVGAIVAGVMYVLWGGMIVLGAPEDLVEGMSVVHATVTQLGILVAIAGLHTLQRGRYTWQYGTVGALMAFVGTVFNLIHAVAYPLVGRDVLEDLSIIGIMLTFVGFLLLGYASMEARVLPRWCGILLFLGVPFVPFLGVLFEGIGGPEIILGVVWTLVGYALLSSSNATTQQSRRVS